MDAASFPVAAKDMANLRGRKVGVPYLPTLPTPVVFILVIAICAIVGTA